MKTKIAIIMSSLLIVMLVVTIPLATSFASQATAPVQEAGYYAYNALSIIFIVANLVGGLLTFLIAVAIPKKKQNPKIRTAWEQNVVDSFASHHLGSFGYVTFIARVRFGFYFLGFWILNAASILLIIIFVI